MDHKVIFTTAAALLLVPSLVLVGFFIALTDHQKKNTFREEKFNLASSSRVTIMSV